MIPSYISRRVIGDRLALIDEMLREIRGLPLGDHDSFFADHRNIWTVDACLRRNLEALLDIGRHILAKGFGIGVSEYKEIAARLQDRHVLADDEAGLLFRMAGYRNRLVHFYHEITPDELYRICVGQLGDIELVADAYRRWVNAHPELVNDRL
jgi:uncharacterized protein YutE (UPF0331/DUF86 family)